jgi:hypothetical protein
VSERRWRIEMGTVDLNKLGSCSKARPAFSVLRARLTPLAGLFADSCQASRKLLRNSSYKVSTSQTGMSDKLLHDVLQVQKNIGITIR